MKLGFIQKYMFMERRKLITAVMVPALVIILLLGLSLAFQVKYLFKFHDISDKEGIEQFRNSKAYTAKLYYDEVFEGEGSVTITTTTQRGVTVIGSYGGGTIPTGETKYNTDYKVYFLRTQDNSYILYCTKGEFDDSKNWVDVSYEYKELEKDIISYFLPEAEDNIYVVYESQKINMIFVIIMLSAVLFMITALQLIEHSKLLQKHSDLGKRIAKLGEFKTVAADINKQEKEAIHVGYQYLICKDYFISAGQATKTVIIPMKDILNITSVPDEYYPEEIINITIEYVEDEETKTYLFNVYNKEDESKILNILKKG